MASAQKKILQLKKPLENLYRLYNAERQVDPVRLARRYDRPQDQEVAALIASCLAYGNVTLIMQNARAVLDLLGPAPHATLQHLTETDAQKRLKGFRHRFNTGTDVARLLLGMGDCLRRYGSLKGAFLKAYEPNAPDLAAPLEAFVLTILKRRCPALAQADGKRTSRLDYLLPRPSRGSACKRLHLFLKWVVRPAGPVDLGLWQEVSPRQLLIPLDTHLWRLSHNLGLTQRKTADWKAAVDVTKNLRVLDPEDPVRFDFALAHLGMEFCGRKRSRCRECPLRGYCQNPVNPDRADRPGP